MAENRELAYRLWRECGQNAELTLRRLRQHPEGFPLSKPTLYDWIETYNWKERAARAEAEEQRAADIQLSFDQKMLADLVRQKEKYETYFATLKDTSTDNQATYAYTSLCRLIAELMRRIRHAEDTTPRAAGRADKTGGLTEERADEIRKKILGIV